MQPKATTLAFTKPNQQAIIFSVYFLARGDAESSVNSNFQSNTQLYAVSEQATKVLYRYRHIYTQNQNSQKQVLRSHLTLNIAIELIKPKLLLITKIIPKLSLQSCPPNVANTMLGICYTCVVLYCSGHGCCTVECCGAC